MTSNLETSRRSFLAGTVASATGFTLGFHIPGLDEASAQTQTPELNAWVVVKPDNTVVIRVARVEMGQGTLTGLAQLVAEELDADWKKVTTDYPTPGENLKRNRVWGNFQTAGSRGIRDSVDYVRKGGATARAMLVQAAANQWGVPVAECYTWKGLVRHRPTNRELPYGALVEAAAKITPPTDVPLKDPKNWTIAGKSLPRLDTKPKLDGSQIYSIDHKMPGMMLAAVKICPYSGGKVKSFDATKIANMKGVKKVAKIDDISVVVIADTWWRAKNAIDQLPIEWDKGPNAKQSSADFAKVLVEGLSADQAFVGNQAGDVKAALASAAKVVEATYAVPHQHHVTMEPMNATVVWTPEKCEVWTATQNAESALATASEAAGLPINQCEVYRLNLGGGFGRRTGHDFVRQAVLIAKEMPGVPVKMIWSREEDMTHGYYHPVTMAKLRGALDKDGNLVGLHMRISGQSILSTINPAGLQNGRDPATFQGLNPSGTEGVFGYSVPNLLIDHAMRNPPIRPGFWRGVNNNQNAFYLESFVDELAAAAGQDPLEFRRKMMKNHPKHLAVLNAVAERVGWGKPAAPGVFRGLAQHMGYGSYVAACAEVSVNAKKEVTIHRIVAATNCGHAVNPQQIAAQIEGSFAYGLTAGLLSEITVKDGKIEQENLDTYPILKMDQMPAVESIVIPTHDFWGGVGEPTIFVATPAVFNAIAAATGKRIRKLPLGDQLAKA